MRLVHIRTVKMTSTMNQHYFQISCDTLCRNVFDYKVHISALKSEKKVQFREAAVCLKG